MKKGVVFVLVALLLCGCGEKETFETISDELLQPVMASPAQVSVSLPGEAAMPAMESDQGRVYLCDDYEIYIQTLDAGDVDATIQAVSGYEKDALTVIETEENGVARYEFVWASAGEKGDRIGRGVVLDDGSYHYVLTVLRDADTTKNSQVVWSDIFASFTLS